MFSPSRRSSLEASQEEPPPSGGSSVLGCRTNCQALHPEKGRNPLKTQPKRTPRTGRELPGNRYTGIRDRISLPQSELNSTRSARPSKIKQLQAHLYGIK